MWTSAMSCFIPPSCVCDLSQTQLLMPCRLQDGHSLEQFVERQINAA